MGISSRVVCGLEGDNMFKTSVTTLNDEKLYLATFEFVSGEYEQFFEKAFYAKNEEDLRI